MKEVKSIIITLVVLRAAMLTISCQKELPDAIKNVEVNKGDQSPASPEISLDKDQGDRSMIAHVERITRPVPLIDGHSADYEPLLL